ncbi:MAG: methyltransferase domain-containing protein [Deltaproteobacteria bacterium]|nr:methyltransferase domain-containing protein [Deltaproteobacteria bacterium]
MAELPDKLIYGDVTLRPGWISADICDVNGGVGFNQIIAREQGSFFIRHNAETPLPLPDNSITLVHSEHFIEHVSISSAALWLSEIKRIVKPGGIIRLVTPDLARYIEGYNDPQQAFFAEHWRILANHPQCREACYRSGIFAPRRAAMVNQIFYFWGHRWIYDFEEMVYLATLAGFDRDQVSHCSFHNGKEPELAALDRENRRDESLYVEIHA